MKLPVLNIFRSSLSVALRSQEIGFVLSAYGLARSLALLGIEASRRGLHFSKVLRPTPVPFDKVFGKNLAKTFVKLGPTFIKLGQVLATRSDLVGDEVAEQLKVLFDRVPPVSFGEIKRILKSQLGKQKMKEWFKEIERVPLASASLSQTHSAMLKDGTRVILKVQKSGVADLVRADLIILEGFVRSLHLLSPQMQLLQMFEDFKHATLREIDYREEAKNIDQFRKNYRKLFSDSDVVFPRYFPELTTEKVIALEPMHGRKVGELKKGTTVARHAAAKGLTAILEQIFDHGFFHADPHAGNLFFLEDEGRIGFIDLGLVGRLDPKDKQKFLKVLLAILKRDREKLAANLYALGMPGKKTRYADFEKAIQKLLDDVQQTGVNNLKMDQLVNRVLGIARRNGIHIPNRYIMMIRACLVIEGVARSLDPKISVFQLAVPVVTKSLLKTYNPLRFLGKFV